MIYPHTGTFVRGSDAASVDAESGLPTTTLVETTVYSGEVFIQDDDKVIGVSSEGDAIRQSEARVFLPPGEWGIEPSDVFRTPSRNEEARIVSVSKFREDFYTEVRVRWR